MNRRDFLFLRRTPKGRVLELSCRALYMYAINANAGTKAPDQDVLAHEPWMGEPPTDFERAEDDHWLRQIERALQDVDVLALVDQEWLISTDIQAQLDTVLAEFRHRGGRIEVRTALNPEA
jgi:hypothetical protein